MPVRFHVPAAERSGEVVALPPDEAEHLTRVLRLKAGASVRVFNGRGAEFDAVVERAGKNGAQVAVGAVREAVAEPRVAVMLAQAVLKGEKMDAVVRDAVMMGVSGIQPVVTTRSEVTLQSLGRSRRTERWERIAVSSAKQCGRAVVPAILEPLDFRGVAASLTGLTLPEPCFMFVEPAIAAGAIAVGELARQAPRQTTVLIGPEGGWTAEEVETGAAVSRLLTLGARTLRADAMPIVAITALLTRWEQL